MSDDPRWPRAADWLATGSAHPRLAVIGVPAYRTSITPTGANTTPAAIRQALARYSTFATSHAIDLAELAVRDAGDVGEPDGPEGEARVQAAVDALAAVPVLLALGGDNSITHSVMQARFDSDLARAGLITLDAHHDLRDGVSNGSPVRRLVEAGLDGCRIVQVGIADFSNSPEYAARARDLGITVITRGALRTRPIADAMDEALELAGTGSSGVHVDIDVDVCDRAVVPGCHASAPGGLSADELRQAAFAAGRDPRVRSIDITEVDATADAPDGRTVRLAALCLLEAAAGVRLR